MVTMWEDVLEATPEDPSAWAVTRRQARESGSERREVEKEQAEWKEGQKENGKVSHKRSENGRSTQGKAESKPGQLVVLIARGAIHWYVKGYLRDPAFKEHWRVF